MKQSRFWYWLGHTLTRLVAPRFWAIRVEYETPELEAAIREQRPPFDKRLIICPRHRHWADPYVIGTFAWDLPTKLRRPLCFLAKVELFWWPFSSILRGQGAIPVKRGQADRQALRQAIHLLRNEQPLVVFAEGKCQPQGLRPLEAGVALLARLTEAAVLPIGTSIRSNPRQYVIRIGQPLSAEQRRSKQETDAQLLCWLLIALERLSRP